MPRPFTLFRGRLLCLALVLVTGATARDAAAVNDPADPALTHIPIWAFPGAYHDSTRIDSSRCVGSFGGPLTDSIRNVPRTITVRFLRNRVAEKRPDFGGYRIYRMTNERDSSRAVLIRRFSRNPGAEITWNFSIMDTAAGSYLYRGGTAACRGQILNDSIATFVDADSNGQYLKICRRPGDFTGRCFSIGDSVFKLNAPPGPHDGFLTWYAITIEKRNTTDPDFEDLFVPDTTGTVPYEKCGVPGQWNTCPNLNNKLRNVAGPVEPTGGPTANLETVAVVPNPYRGGEVWDRPGQSEVHFINLPANAKISIYTSAGDLVRVIEHSDKVRDFERWDLMNGAGRGVASGIYVYRIEAGKFNFQSRFVVIR